MIKEIIYKGFKVKVSDDGKFVSVNGVERKPWKFTPKRSKTAYYQVTLKRSKKAYLHVLVALAFVPNPNNKPKVIHINFDGLDNRAENLVWGEWEDVHLRYKLLGKPHKRHTAQFIKFNKDFWDVIKRLKRGDTLKSIAEDYGTSDMSIHRFKVRNQSLLKKRKKKSFTFIKTKRDFWYLLYRLKRGDTLMSIAEDFNTSDMSIHRFKVKHKELLKEMRFYTKFEEKGNPCPLCKTYEDKEYFLVPIHDTVEGHIAQAERVHVDCILKSAVLYRKDGDVMIISR